MPFSTNETQVYRRDVKTKGQALSFEEREALLKKYLPDPKSISKPQKIKLSSADLTAPGLTSKLLLYFRSLLHIAIHVIIQFIFGIYIRMRQIFNACIQKFLTIRHYHHRTPAYIQKDTQNLSRIPQHLSILLRYDPRADDETGLETLIDEVAELCAWSTAAGVPLLSIYEKTGVLKTYMSSVQELVHQKLVQYFGAAPQTPSLRIHAPNLPDLSPMPSERRHNNSHPAPAHLDLLLLSATDGRDTLVDLTRTLTEMSQSSKLRPKDITSTLINTEINATTSVLASLSTQSKPHRNSISKNTHHTNGTGNRVQKTTSEALPSEPDLLLVFAPYVKLDGYPPWQIRLTEIFCVGDSGGDVSGRGLERRTRVEYQGFLRGLWKYAGAEMRFGR